MAATTNGAVTPPARAEHDGTHLLADSAERKRKREDNMSHDPTSSEDAQTQRDILDLLRQYVRLALMDGHC